MQLCCIYLIIADLVGIDHRMPYRYRWISTLFYGGIPSVANCTISLSDFAEVSGDEANGANSSRRFSVLSGVSGFVSQAVLRLSARAERDYGVVSFLLREVRGVFLRGVTVPVAAEGRMRDPSAASVRGAGFGIGYGACGYERYRQPEFSGGASAPADDAGQMQLERTGGSGSGIPPAAGLQAGAEESGNTGKPFSGFNSQNVPDAACKADITVAPDSACYVSAGRFRAVRFGSCLF